MNALLIIGNGFDLSFGLKTSYSDFIKSDEFDEVGMTSLGQYLANKQELQNWVDIEKELSTYCYSIYNKNLRFVNEEDPYAIFKKEYEILCEQLKAYLKKTTNRDIQVDDKSIAYNLISDLYNSRRSPLDIISFNYTDIIDRISQYPLINIRGNVYHVHGSLDADIVFGVEDSAKLKRSELYLYKSYSKYKQTGSLMKMLKRYKNIIFFGYSLGDTDRQYFERYFKKLAQDSDELYNIAFYCYGQSAYDDVKWQLMTYTDHNLSGLEMNHNIEYIDSSREFYVRPKFLNSNKVKEDRATRYHK